jgi:hypothetical protein
MNNKELKNIIKQIEKTEGIKLAKIASMAEVNRSYLSTTINNKETKNVEDAFIGKIAKRFPAYFNQHKQTDGATSEIMVNLNEIRGYIISILTGQTAGQKLMMNSLDRLEKNPEGTLSSEADKLALMLAERLNRIEKGRKAGMHK